MRILLVEADPKRAQEIKDYALNRFGLLRDCSPEYVIVNDYQSEYLEAPFGSINWRRGEFDAVVITSVNIKNHDYGDEGPYGLVYAEQAKKRDLSCVIVLPHDQYWMFHVAGPKAIPTWTDGNYDISKVFIALCEMLCEKGKDYY